MSPGKLAVRVRVCEALPNWAVLVREACATAGCTCALPPYNTPWFRIWKAGVNCSVYKPSILCSCVLVSAARPDTNVSILLCNGRTGSGSGPTWIRSPCAEKASFWSRWCRVNTEKEPVYVSAHKRVLGAPADPVLSLHAARRHAAQRHAPAQLTVGVRGQSSMH